MKSILAILLTVLLLGSTALADEAIDLTQMTPAELEALIAAAQMELTMQEDKMICEAIEVLKESYKTFYGNRERIKVGYLEINDTKVFYIKDNFRLSDEEDQELAEDLFGDVKCIVCFSLYSDVGTAPYYPAGGMFDAVMVYEDGSMEAGPNPFYRYVYTRYESSLLEVISSISDRDSEFNNTWYLLK